MCAVICLMAFSIFYPSIQDTVTGRLPNVNMGGIIATIGATARILAFTLARQISV